MMTPFGYPEVSPVLLINLFNPMILLSKHQMHIHLVFLVTPFIFPSFNQQHSIPVSPFHFVKTNLHGTLVLLY